MVIFGSTKAMPVVRNNDPPKLSPNGKPIGLYHVRFQASLLSPWAYMTPFKPIFNIN